jgi:ribonuclease-3
VEIEDESGARLNHVAGPARGRARPGRHLLLGRGEEKTGGRRKQALLADGYEALIAAIYLDGGVEQATTFIARQFEELDARGANAQAAFHDYKSALQERVQSGGDPLPEYTVIGEVGPIITRRFRCRCGSAGEPMAEATGRSKKEAEQEAARLALRC